MDVTILLVEDDPYDLLLVTEIFGKAAPGARLQVVRNGEEATSYLSLALRDGREAPMPDVVLLDLRLPRKSGFEVLQWMRRDPVLKEVPVLVHSSSPEPRDILRAYALGANSYFVKALDMKDMRDVAGAIAVYASRVKARRPAPAAAP